MWKAWTQHAKRVAKDLLTPRGRRIAASTNRVFIEYRPVAPHAFAELARDVRQSLTAIPGVQWIELNPYMQRLAASTDGQDHTVKALLERLEAVEARHGLSHTPFPLDAIEHPADDEPLLRNATQIGVALGGAVLGAALRTARIRPRRLHADLASVSTLLKSVPQLRTLLEDRLGAGRTDMALTLIHSLLHATAAGPTAPLMTAVYRSIQRRELHASRRAWTEREVQLCAKPAHQPSPPQVVPRPVPLPQGPIERYADGAWTVSLGGFAVGMADTQELHASLAPLLDAAPTPANYGREVFASHVHRTLADRGVICRHPAAVRQFDRIDTVVVDQDLLMTGARLLGQVVAQGEADEAEVRAVAARLFDSSDPRKVAEGDGYRLGPWESLGLHLEGETERAVRAMRSDCVLALARNANLIAFMGADPELDPVADELLAAVRRAKLQLVLAASGLRRDSQFGPDRWMPGGRALIDSVRALQIEGRVVALVADGNSDDALAAADVGIGLCRRAGGTPWGAHLLCHRDLEQAVRIVQAIPAARRISEQSVKLSLAGAGLGAFLSVRGLRQSSVQRVSWAVSGAAAVAMVNGMHAARRLERTPAVQRRDATPWHSLDPEDALSKAHSSREGLSEHQAQERLRSIPRPATYRPSL